MPRKKDPYFKIVPTSCRCGGMLAWMAVDATGSEMMCGCVCHYTPHSLINVPLRIGKAEPSTTRKRKAHAQTATQPIEKDTI